MFLVSVSVLSVCFDLLLLPTSFIARLAFFYNTDSAIYQEGKKRMKQGCSLPTATKVIVRAECSDISQISKARI